MRFHHSAGAGRSMVLDRIQSQQDCAHQAIDDSDALAGQEILEQMFHSAAPAAANAMSEIAQAAQEVSIEAPARKKLSPFESELLEAWAED